MELPWNVIWNSWKANWNLIQVLDAQNRELTDRGYRYKRFSLHAARSQFLTFFFF